MQVSRMFHTSFWRNEYSGHLLCIYGLCSFYYSLTIQEKHLTKYDKRKTQ